MKYSSVITTKGTITIPAELRKKLGYKPGVRVDIFQDNQSRLVTVKPALTWADLQKKNQNILKRDGVRALSDEELDNAIDQSWANARGSSR